MTTPTRPAMRYHSIAVTPPPTGRAVLIWWHVGEVTATFDGQCWHDEHGAPLPGPITHWREIPAP